ncbi:hypothetical protein DFH29DRAFT_870344 [Suillus ampliporus]|nr:hypothetical protein DFH29DRAFT_870344 [Suillus ampliporus]
MDRWIGQAEVWTCGQVWEDMDDVDRRVRWVRWMGVEWVKQLDHILELTGPDTYFAWKWEVTYALGIKDQWCHVTDTVDPNDVLGDASFKPVPANPLLPTTAETKAIRDWLIQDLKAKSIITRRLSASVQQLVSTSHKVTARDAWKTLADHIG